MYRSTSSLGIVEVNANARLLGQEKRIRRLNAKCIHVNKMEVTLYIDIYSHTYIHLSRLHKVRIAETHKVGYADVVFRREERKRERDRERERERERE